MGLMKNKFLELCEREGLEPDYDNRISRIIYAFKDENGHKTRSYFKVDRITHELKADLSNKSEHKVILEFAGFVSTLIGE